MTTDTTEAPAKKRGRRRKKAAAEKPPPAPKKDPRVMLTCRVGPTGVQALDAIGAREGWKRSEMVRDAIADYVKKHTR